MNSRALLALAICLFCCIAGAAQEDPPLRVGITPAIVHDQYDVMTSLRVYLEAKLGRRVSLISRDSYRETIELLKHNRMDFAWVSDYPYVYLSHYHFAKMVAMPVYHGRSY